MVKVEAMSMMTVSVAKSQSVKKTDQASGSFDQLLSGGKDGSQAVLPEKKASAPEKPDFMKEQRSKSLKKKEDFSLTSGENASVSEGAAASAGFEEASQVVYEIRQIVKVEISADDATIDQTLRSMGISLIDLLNPDILKDFILQLTGNTDMTDLLMNEGLLDSFQNVLDLISDFAQTNQDEILALMNFLETPVSLDELPGKQEFAELLQQLTGVSAEDAVRMAEEQIVVEHSDLTVPQERMTGASDQALTEGEKGVVSQDSQALSEEPVLRVAVGAAEEKQDVMDGSQDSEGKPLFDGKDAKAEVLVSHTSREAAEEESEVEASVTELFADRGQTEAAREVRGTEEPMEPLFDLNPNPNLVQGNIGEIAEANFQSAGRMLQAIDIVHQISEQMKTDLSEGMTRLEMQLNPESLGKVLLTVSAKEGVMTATFRVQTEDARQALESQMFQLKENLEAKNIKVEAVDVQISNFNFSESSEAERQMKEELEQKGKKKFTFVTEEDNPEAEDAESRAELVRRQVMRDAGGSIDFTA